MGGGGQRKRSERGRRRSKQEEARSGHNAGGRGNEMQPRIVLSFGLPPHLPLAGAPSMTSYLVMVSLSLYWLDPVPAVSLRMMAISMCLILMRTSKK